MRVLITGGAGFIGAHLAEVLLAEGIRVDLVDNFSRGRRDADLGALLAHPDIGCIARDLLTPGCLDDLGDGYDLIVHLAAIVGVANVAKQPFAVLRNNLEMLTGILDFAKRQRRLCRLVFASTSEVHAGSLRHLTLPVPTPERAPIALPDLAEARSSYLLSKLYGEALCRHSGLPITIVRPYNIYGPRMGMAHVIPELFRRAFEASAGGRLTAYSPDHRRAFCYVRDAVEMIKRLALSQEAVGEVFNVGNQDEPITIRDLAQRVVETVGKSLTVEAGSETPGSPSRRCPDMTRTLAVTDFAPEVGLGEGLRRTFLWYRVNVLVPEGMAAS
ncbi:MAG: NAD-dependent epimerase/dehydratase family protein [Kiloniellaceae bacterium]